MEERYILIMKHIIDVEAKSKGWGLVDIVSAKSYRVELEDFEPITYQDDTMKEFENLLKYRDEHIDEDIKDVEHIKVLVYGKDKNNNTIALVLIKDYNEKPTSYAIIAYDIGKTLEILRTFKKYKEHPEL